jgi:hypothetical protein
VIGVLWFLEKNAELMVCEVRRAGNGVYEYEETAPTGQSRVERYDEASDLLDGYIRAQQEKQREGWRPQLLSYTIGQSAFDRTSTIEHRTSSDGAPGDLASAVEHLF